MATVSIIMGIYNCASTLRESVSSLQAQSYSDWELIMCDDGSSDNTLDIALQIASEDKRIKVIFNESNIGLAATLNSCLQEASGEFVARMDGDDLCDKDRIQKEFEFLSKHEEYAFVSGWMECFDEQGVYGIVRYREKPEFENLVKGSQFCHAACLMRREILQYLGGYCTAPETERVEDYDLWVRFYIAGYKGYNLQQVIYSMRDDRNAYRRRKFKYRINESRISYRVYKTCHLSIRWLAYPILPILKGMLPTWVYTILHKKRISV